MFLLECAVRAMIMFVAVLFLFKLTGKREVRQFSVLELIVVIGLGSALGDAMIYTDSPILPSVVAMLVVLLCYYILNKWMNRSRSMEKLIEGEVIKVFANNVVDIEASQGGNDAHEFYGGIACASCGTIGQVKSAYVEIDGDVSIFFRPMRMQSFAHTPTIAFPGRLPTTVPVSCVGCGAVQEKP